MENNVCICGGIINSNSDSEQRQLEENKKHMSFYLPLALYKMLKSQAAQQNRTMTRYIIIAVVEKLKRESL